MSMIKPILAALAITTAAAGPAFAQQSSAPGDTPAASQVQQRPEADDPGRDERGPRRRWEREFRRGESDERRDRRSYDEHDRMGRPGGMMMHRPGMMRFCAPQGGRFADAMLERLERATRPTPEQQPLFDQLTDAAGKAAAIIRAACPAEISVTPPGRLAAAEKRLAAMLEAVRAVRPAMEAYYNALSDEQKARLYLSRRGMEPMGERNEWRGGERGERRDGDRERRFERWRDRGEDGPSNERDGRTDNDRSGNSKSEPL
jgi:hypothetical protein